MTDTVAHVTGYVPQLKTRDQVAHQTAYLVLTKPIEQVAHMTAYVAMMPLLVTARRRQLVNG